MNILVIEDDTRIAALVERALREEGHRVTICYDGRNGVDTLVNGVFDVALLDILLPGIDGFSVLERARNKQCKTPVLVLTAVDAVPKVLRAFDLGADDYLVKPFILEILLARVTALARRTIRNEPPILNVGDVTLDRSRRIAMRDGREISLTRKQFALLETLMRRKGLITSREQLIEAGWGDIADVKENTLDVYIHGLRTKLQRPTDADSTLIRTVHGIGYIFEAIPVEGLPH
ncbi:response regulator transcription factor [Terriglobus roseus]|uniref:Two-component system, OmpR family, copper resistance phosphate regulon response regulator CusR n=1 Tax=Terriglobus roseus TaxID=392734 RepID=A0A1G7GRT4_9BACT|nr:response regulator transcription factor [Terriglobus roseus]SDE90753.1 two-component system, OmpR family, copper resistance phosphate regulon response regulator CusR [Terriglobus roseus]